MVSRIAKKEHVAVLAQFASRISAITKCGAGAGDDPFANSHSSDEVETPRVQVQFMRKIEKVTSRGGFFQGPRQDVRECAVGCETLALSGAFWSKRRAPYGFFFQCCFRTSSRCSRRLCASCTCATMLARRFLSVSAKEINWAGREVARSLAVGDLVQMFFRLSRGSPIPPQPWVQSKTSTWSSNVVCVSQGLERMLPRSSG